MGKIKQAKKFSDRKLCFDSFSNTISTSFKLLDSADVSDKISKCLFQFYQKNTSKLITEVKCLQVQKKELIKELSVANERLGKVDEINRKLTDEAERLRRNLEVIREVLQDSDIDKVKERLAQLEENSWLATTPQGRRRQSHAVHSAGSLLDSENASSTGESDVENKDQVKRVPTPRVDSKFARDADIDISPNTSLPRKRSTPDDVEGYHDVSFKRMAIDQTKLEDNGCSSTDLDVSPTFTRKSVAFQTPVKPGQKGVVENRLTRLHDFQSISALRFGVCSCCGKRFTLGKPGVRCKVCRLVVHVQCQHQLKQRCVPPADLPVFNSPMTLNTSALNSPLPMTPATLSRLRSGGASLMTPSTPTSSTVKRQPYPSNTLSLDALCPPNESPRIPAAVILCVNEVASRGLNLTGIYRIPGGERKVQELMEKFLYSKTAPSLALIEDIHVVCSCLKAFLRLLDEPLVTYKMRCEFVTAGKLFLTDPESAKCQTAELIGRLPTANRDTLAFLMLHLKDVARSKVCKMGESNLAKVFGLTVVGYSSAELPLAVASSEIPSQQVTVRLLMAIPDGVYSAIVGYS